MSHLFLINDSFEVQHILQTERDKTFVDFCSAIDEARLAGDVIYATPDIHTRQFSYGTFFYGLLYADWHSINNHPQLKGISNTAHSLYHAITFGMPGFVQMVATEGDFVQKFAKEHTGNAGFRIPQPPLPYVCCKLTWQTWKQIWYQSRQDLIPWPKGGDRWLPNVSVSNEILKAEVIRHGKEAEVKKNQNNWALTFHEEVMRKKGNEMAAYTIEIGKRITEANYYIYEEELSQNEQNAAGSLRNIYSILSSDQTKQYISLDHRHGMFEFHTTNGTHKGEFKFDGSYNSEAQVSHNLKTIR